MISKKAYVKFAKNILNIVKWMATISFLGVKVDIQHLIIVKCFVKIVII